MKQLWPDLSGDAQDQICEKIRNLIRENSRITKTSVNLAFACRVLACKQSPENIETLSKIFKSTTSVLIKRDIILAMFNWRNWAWISDLRSEFSSFPPPLRRAFIIGSYALSDEGNHWRNNNRQNFSPFELLVRDWAASNVSAKGGDSWQAIL